jgi:CelD/BcsL family acetyltransferase involved in cellulose biosynthesis
LPASGDLEIRPVSTAGEFEALAGSWSALAATIPLDTVFLTHPWLSNWHRVYGVDAGLLVLTAWSDERLVAALPLALRKDSTGIRRVEFMGTGSLTPNHLDMLALPEWREESLRRFALELIERRGTWDVVDLDKLPADTGTASAMRALMEAAGCRSMTGVSAVCPCGDLPETLDAYLAGLSKSKRRHLRQKRTRLYREHPTAEFRLVQDVSELEPVLEALVGLHQQRWQDLGYAGSFAEPQFLAFHRMMVRDALDGGFLRMSTLAFEDSIVAVNYCFRVGETVQGYMTGFDTRWAKVAPGVMLDLDTVARAIEEGARRFDLLEGQHEWKYRWVSSERENLRLQIFGGGARGRMARLKEQATASSIDAARRHVPDGTREAVRKRIERVRADRRNS